MLKQSGGALQEDLMVTDVGRVGIPPWSNTA